MSKILDSRLVKTRKPHKCFGCDRTFPAGTIMELSTVVDVDKLFGSYLCDVCLEIVSDFPLGEEFCRGDLRDEALEREADRIKRRQQWNMT